MDETQFWAVIEAGGREAFGDPERQLAALGERLHELTPEDLIEFHRLFNRKIADAYSWDLWGAAYLINGGCSDDGFAYFRSWLISRGQEVYTAALRSPDSLAGLVDSDRDNHEFEDLWGIARQVYRDSTGQEMPEIDLPCPAEPWGKRWDFSDDDQASRRLPNLARSYT